MLGPTAFYNDARLLCAGPSSIPNIKCGRRLTPGVGRGGGGNEKTTVERHKQPMYA